MGKTEKFLEGIKFSCFIESAKFFIDKEGQRKVRTDIVVKLVGDDLAFLPVNIQSVAKSMATNKVEKSVFGQEIEERFVEIYTQQGDTRPAIVAEDVSIKNVRLECDVEVGIVSLHFSFTGDDKLIGSWIHENYGRDAWINVLAMQGELSGL